MWQQVWVLVPVQACSLPCCPAPWALLGLTVGTSALVWVLPPAVPLLAAGLRACFPQPWKLQVQAACCQQAWRLLRRVLQVKLACPLLLLLRGLTPGLVVGLEQGASAVAANGPAAAACGRKVTLVPLLACLPAMCCRSARRALLLPALPLLPSGGCPGARCPLRMLCS